MTKICKEIKPKGYDPKKDVFRQHWVTNTNHVTVLRKIIKSIVLDCNYKIRKNEVMKKQGLSVRKATTIKKIPIFSRFHKVHNYHHYAQFELADNPPSSESEGEDEESPNLVHSK